MPFLKIRDVDEIDKTNAAKVRTLKAQGNLVIIHTIFKVESRDFVTGLLANAKVPFDRIEFDRATAVDQTSPLPYSTRSAISDEPWMSRTRKKISWSPDRLTSSAF